MSLSVLRPFKQCIDEALALEFCDKSSLHRAMNCALVSGGKRIRPMITMMVAEALGNGWSVLPSALSVEFSHTASLIADDLPCMDDEQERRGVRCLHLEFGEATAILATYGLITAAYGKLVENGKLLEAKGSSLAHKATTEAIALASRASGCKGATLGQHLDLYEVPDSEEAIEHLIYLKTITLFEMAMAFGWIFGGGALDQIGEVKRAAYHLGMAFQVRDDLFDFDEDQMRGCKSNYAVFLGRGRAKERFSHEIKSFRGYLEQLNLQSAPFEALLMLLT